MDYYNKQFYQSQLIATISPEDSPEANELRTLSRILPKRSDATNKNPFGICFVNIDGRNERMENKKSWENIEEATAVSEFFYCNTFFSELNNFVFAFRLSTTYQSYLNELSKMTLA